MGISELTIQTTEDNDFTIKLDEKYGHPGAQSFLYPKASAICDAIATYGNKNGMDISFLSKEYPISFTCNGSRYQAELTMGYGHYHPGFYVRCQSLNEES